MESKQADEILTALPWRCFQCGWANIDDHERLETLQDTIRELNHGADSMEGRALAAEEKLKRDSSI